MPTVLVTGANRGLGLEFCRQYLADGWQVIAVCRNPDAADALAALDDGTGALDIEPAEMTDFSSIDRLAERLADRPIDLLINNAGVFGPSRRTDDDYGQSFGHIDYDTWAEVFRINTLAPMKMAEALIANVQAGEQKKIVTISSRISSVSEKTPGLYAYRTSKSAVNKVMATLANEPEAAGIICVSFNPGWVRTDMGGDAAPLAVEESIGRLRLEFDRLTLDDSGSFLDYDGSRISA